MYYQECCYVSLIFLGYTLIKFEHNYAYSWPSIDSATHSNYRHRRVRSFPKFPSPETKYTRPAFLKNHKGFIPLA